MTSLPNSTESNSPNENGQIEVPNGIKPELANEANNYEIKIPPPKKQIYGKSKEISYSWMISLAIALMVGGLWFHFEWLGFSASLVALLLSLQVILPSARNWVSHYLTPDERKLFLGFFGLVLASAGLFNYLGFYRSIGNWLNQFKYDEFGSWAEWVGALGQISIAVLAVYVAWAQYVISKELTTQQNKITQQQTIDAYFQGVSDLALNEEGLLEDWPQERAIAEGRTASILSSVDASGKAKILRFLSRSRLVTPLQRDSHLGRPMFDGNGGYAEDRVYGVRVISLGVMLAGTDLAGQDLRWADLSEANMVRTNLNHSDLVKANLSRTILYEANLAGADLKNARLFYGKLETASPRSRTIEPDYETGAHTGAVIEKADLSEVKNLSEEQRYYCCCWGGEKTRATIPGGCEGIPNLLGKSAKFQEK
ncbi:MAG: pentapeptide repeat-containing protein [Gomphosphaeria aponina SAG 52.96 = DSM 107014]|uniref:Pentapeptide repeat-containing protein n=1 Tax=Gomphosphaeria aponina SAG 52.96 = DSM 107014 TaxID=1521640 RepID=A0A941JSF0_9CHRO|nr:pentapeptide repeat-containing protein [Gomphosphaeria aponina SAG 52.96 = DSM 107014]